MCLNDKNKVCIKAIFVATIFFYLSCHSKDLSAMLVKYFFFLIYSLCPAFPPNKMSKKINFVVVHSPIQPYETACPIEAHLLKIMVILTAACQFMISHNACILLPILILKHQLFFDGFFIRWFL